MTYFHYLSLISVATYSRKMNRAKDDTNSTTFVHRNDYDKDAENDFNTGFEKSTQTFEMNRLENLSPSSPSRSLKYWFIPIIEPNKTLNSLPIFLFGQLIALSLASNSAAASTIGSFFELQIPVFQSALAYMILAFHLFWLPTTKNNISRENIDENKIISTVIKKSLSNVEDEKKEDEINERDTETSAVDDIYRLPFNFTSRCIHKPWWIYAFVAFLDVQANFIFVMSFRYTSITSASLLSSMCVPAAIMSSRVLLKRSFSSIHFLGVAVCLMGACLMVWSDMHSPDSNLQSLSSSSSSNANNSENNYHDIGNGNDHPTYFQYRYPLAWLGDSFAILGALLYGINDTIAEYCVSNIDRIEYLAMLGFFGSIISILQSIITEWSGLYNLFFCEDRLAVFITLAWYAISLAIFYIAVSFFLTISEATLLTLSLQTEDMWTTLFSVLAQGRKVPPFIFYVAATLEISGVCLYEIGLPKQVKNLCSLFSDTKRIDNSTKRSSYRNVESNSNTLLLDSNESHEIPLCASYGSL